MAEPAAEQVNPDDKYTAREYGWCLCAAVRRAEKDALAAKEADKKKEYREWAEKFIREWVALPIPAEEEKLLKSRSHYVLKITGTERHLAEAYLAAEARYTNAPSNIAALREYGWILYDCVIQACDRLKNEKLAKQFQEKLQALAVPESEGELSGARNQALDVAEAFLAGGAEIVSDIESGKTMDSFQKLCKLLEEHPGNYRLQRLMSRCVYALSTQLKEAPEGLKLVAVYAAALKFSPEEEKLQAALGWEVCARLKELAVAKKEQPAALAKHVAKKAASKSAKLTVQLLRTIDLMDKVDRTSLLYHKLLRWATKACQPHLAGRRWQVAYAFLNFVEKWDLRNLSESDFKPDEGKNGKQYPSLCETLVPALYKAMKLYPMHELPEGIAIDDAIRIEGLPPVEWGEPAVPSEDINEGANPPEQMAGAVRTVAADELLDSNPQQENQGLEDRNEEEAMPLMPMEIGELPSLELPDIGEIPSPETDGAIDSSMCSAEENSDGYSGEPPEEDSDGYSGEPPEEDAYDGDPGSPPEEEPEEDLGNPPFEEDERLRDEDAVLSPEQVEALRDLYEEPALSPEQIQAMRDLDEPPGPLYDLDPDEQTDVVRESESMISDGEGPSVREWVADFLGEQVDRYPHQDLFPYYYGKALAWANRKEEARSVLIRVASLNQSKFWVWGSLAELYEEDHRLNAAFMARALICPVEDEKFKGGIRRQIQKLLQVHPEYGPEDEHVLAKEADKYVFENMPSEAAILESLHPGKRGGPSEASIGLVLEGRYESMRVHADDFEVLHGCHPGTPLSVRMQEKEGKPIIVAMELRSGGEPWDVYPGKLGVVTGWDRSKKIAYALFGLERICQIDSGKIPEAAEFEIGTVVELKVWRDPIRGIDHAKAARKTERPPPAEFSRTLEGDLAIPPGKSFGFVDDVYVSAGLVEQAKLATGDFVEGLAVISTDRKTLDKRWRAITASQKT